MQVDQNVLRNRDDCETGRLGICYKTLEKVCMGIFMVLMGKDIVIKRTIKSCKEDLEVLGTCNP